MSVSQTPEAGGDPLTNLLIDQRGEVLLGHFDSGNLSMIADPKLSKAKFYSDARPGDTLIYTAVVDDIRKDGAMVTATSYKNEELHAEMSIFFAHLDDAYQDKHLFEPGDLLKMMRVLRAYDVGIGPDGGPLREPEENGSGAPAKPGGQT